MLDLHLNNGTSKTNKIIYLKTFSIFFIFPFKKNNPPAPNNEVGIAKYRRSRTGSPHISNIVGTSIRH